ncbi:scoloptoxin SSD14 [Venturia canescens]|uniref:scoloptoxin SSD14 n=1 Tax=Venturia canescens TaxID=32260 RepID=UPI001C9C0117|nr:scoloptoxin SSD14 [Venturia canescens]
MLTCVHRKKILIGGGVTVILLAILITVLVLTIRRISDLDVTESWGPKFTSQSQLGVYEKAAVSSNGGPCSKIGVDMLRDGGSAVDAAIAALLCEGVASLHSAGLGGGFLMTIWDPSNGGEATFLDARESAPSKAHRDMFNGDGSAAMYGGKAIAVPGELLGYWKAHKRYGKLEWSKLFKPTIKLCKEGVVVNDYLAESLLKKVSLIRNEPSLAEILINPITNSTWAAGEKIFRPVLAQTLHDLSVATDPVRLFYNGTMGEKIIEEIQGFGGIMVVEDLQKYEVHWRKPIVSKRNKLTMYTAPPPGSGVILSFIMNLLRELVPTTNETIFWQRITESFKWAYARRTELGDPDFENIDSLLANLTSPSYADEIKKMIDDNWTSDDPKHYGVTSATPTDSGTAHVSVLAPDGSAVSVTSTINQVLGSMRRSRSTGIIFNDEMDDFSSPNITNGFELPPSPSNFIKPGKRPLSSMTPTIIVDENNKVRLVIGAAGGTKITTAIATTMILNLWSGYNIKQAVDARRLHHQLVPMTIHYEPHFNETILSNLRSMGHVASPYSGIGSAMTAIEQNNGKVLANSDYRRQGTVDGF